MPFLIIVYDIAEKRVTKVNKYLKQYLFWRQNSVFEGELSDGELKSLKAGLNEIIETDVDMVIIYSVKQSKHLKTEIMGTEKEKKGFII